MTLVCFKGILKALLDDWAGLTDLLCCLCRKDSVLGIGIVLGIEELRVLLTGNTTVLPNQK